MNQNIRTHNLGFPRIGAKRELKHSIESFWSGKIGEAQLLDTAKAVRIVNWSTQRAAGIDLIPSNDFSLYDHVLDTCALTGAVPERFHWSGGNVDLKTYFAMARGLANGDATCQGCGTQHATTALEMTKWFDTNYHYLVPEFHPCQKFRLSSTKPFDEWNEAKALGIETKPVLLGPVSFLLLGKMGEGSRMNPLSLLSDVLPVYAQALERLAELGVSWVQLDEPALALDLNAGQRAAYEQAYRELRNAAPKLKIMLATYFGDLRENLDAACRLPVDALHIDVVRSPGQLESVFNALPKELLLSLGVVDGRNIWKTNYAAALALLRRASEKIGADRLLVAPSCSLLHAPLSLKHERKLDPEPKQWLAFAEEKLVEVVELAGLLDGSAPAAALEANQAVMKKRRGSYRIHSHAVKTRCSEVKPEDYRRASPFIRRRELQQTRLKLPAFPTTTIGSFPQTAAVRTARAQFKKGGMSAAEYERFLETETNTAVQKQDRLGLDVLVHGEFERNDMVEYFGEQLAGFAFTENGWVQSYGSRCVKPPILYGDVERSRPMTVRWSKFAQSLTEKPVKGMLTGPITILQWSFVRDDQPRSETAKQLALAIRDEVRDLETAGLAVIQIDEPALREGLPLRRGDWGDYLHWAVDAFRLATSGVRDETQIHTHMCYCEFNNILQSIAAMDADVISIEASRSKMELLEAFAEFRYPNDIGPGVWDIHSPRVPSSEEMFELIRAAAKVIPRERLWVNPDCGLKTRRWEEVELALANLVTAAHEARNDQKTGEKRPILPAQKPLRHPKS